MTMGDKGQPGRGKSMGRGPEVRVLGEHPVIHKPCSGQGQSGITGRGSLPGLSQGLGPLH